MDTQMLINGLLMYLTLLILLTFHEFGHAWMAWRCGDDTARLEGRMSLNPLVHIDPIGTVLLPLLVLFVPGLGGFLFGWAKPVPVNPYNLRNPRRDDILVSLAGPWMNLLLAIVLTALIWVGVLVHSPSLMSVCGSAAQLSLLLCFFNLLPIPPLDGSQVVRSLTGMSYEAYHQIARYGFIILILVFQLVPQVGRFVYVMSERSFLLIAGCLGM